MGNDALSIIPLAQSVLEYGAMAGAMSGVVEDFHKLTSVVQDQFFGIAFEIRILIGLGLIVTVALWVRRPSGA